MQNYHNVSVRLTDDEYNKLLFLLEKFNRMSYGKVSLADVLRTAIKDLHLQESKDMSIPVAIERGIREDELQALEQQHHKENLDALAILEQAQKELQESKVESQQLVQLETTEDLKHPLEDVQEDLIDIVEDNKAEDVHRVLEALENELRTGTNTKGNPYTESYIKNALNKKRKELLK